MNLYEMLDWRTDWLIDASAVLSPTAKKLITLVCGAVFVLLFKMLLINQKSNKTVVPLHCIICATLQYMLWLRNTAISFSMLYFSKGFALVHYNKRLTVLIISCEEFSKSELSKKKRVCCIISCWYKAVKSSNFRYIVGTNWTNML